MYHDITQAAVGSLGGGGPARFAVAADEFARQLAALRDGGWTVRALGETLRAGADGERERTVVVTFDDGDAGQYERGFRALRELGMRATFFVTTDWIGRAGFVTWEQLREMRAAGMEVQSHARTHRLFSALDATELVTELRGAKAALDAGLGQDTDILALPGGDWPRRPLRHLIGDAGYRVVATSRWGTNSTRGGDAPVVIRRCTVQGTMDPAAFRRIAAGDPWIGRRRRLREGALAALRAVLGATRYAAWRKAVLDTLG